MLPIRFANGLIALQRTEKDDKNGPEFFALITKDDAEVRIKGYATVLGISTEVTIKVTDAGFEFQIKGDILGILKADLTLTAQYGNPKTMGFMVSF